ncbi:hypothetical protein Tco_0986503 [Tanacetum coccineum]
MATTKAITYALQYSDMIVESVQFQSTAVVEDPNPSTHDYEARPLKEFIINFTVKNDQMPLTLNYKTFCQTTRLDYNNGDYVAHPSTKGNTKPAIKGLPFTADEDTRKSSPLSKAKPLIPKIQRETYNLLLWDFLPLTLMKVDKTQSTRFEMSGSVQNKSETFFKVEPDTEPLKLTNFGEIQALLGDFEDELRYDSDEEVYEAGEEIIQSTNEETQPLYSTEYPTKELVRFKKSVYYYMNWSLYSFD